MKPKLRQVATAVILAGLVLFVVGLVWTLVAPISVVGDIGGLGLLLAAVGCLLKIPRSRERRAARRRYLEHQRAKQAGGRRSS